MIKKACVPLMALFLLMGLLFSQPSHAGVITPIDLNDFFADPTVTVAMDGSTATLAEDSGFSFVLLSNDPGASPPDLNIIIPGANTFLLFDYVFTEGATGDDEFAAFILDQNSSSAGASFELFLNASGSGSASFDLSTLVLQTTLGLQFELNSLFGDDTAFDSIATVSNVRLETFVASTSVPEPSTISLLLMILAGFTVIRLHRKKEII